jgi:hypothetical protein
LHNKISTAQHSTSCGLWLFKLLITKTKIFTVMKKITFLALGMTLVSFAVKGQVALNQDPIKTVNHCINAGIKVDTLHTVVDTLNITFHWGWESEALTSINNQGHPTVVSPLTYGSTDFLDAPQKIATRKGFMWRAKSKTGYEASRTTFGDMGRLGTSLNGGGDAVWFENVAALKTYIGSNKTDYIGNLDGTGAGKTLTYAVDSALACVFNKTADDAALGIYPGKFKDVDLQFAIRSDKHFPTHDMEFDVMTYDAGNTGKTAVWDVIISVITGGTLANAYTDAKNVTDSVRLGESGEILGGTDKLSRRWKAYSFTTTTTPLSDVHTINVNTVTGLKPADLLNKTVIIALRTAGTEGATDNATGTYDPIVVIDNIKWGAWNKEQAPVGYNSAVASAKASATKVIGLKGQIEITGAQNSAVIYNITGQKVASTAAGASSTVLPAGVYLVAEKGQPIVKVHVK